MVFLHYLDKSFLKSYSVIIMILLAIINIIIFTAIIILIFNKNLTYKNIILVLSIIMIIVNLLTIIIPELL